MFKDFLVSFMFLLNIITIKAQWSLLESAEGLNNYTGRIIVCGSVVDVTASPSTCNGCFGVIPVVSGTGNYNIFYAPRNNLRLDFDKSRNYQITATCRDTGKPEVVGLTVIPNLPPTFQDRRTRITISSNTETGKTVHDLKPHDPQEPEKLTFTITERPDNGFFSINGSGVIIAKKDMNTFCEPEDVTVTMSDPYNPAVTRTITMDPGSNVKPVLKDWNRRIVLPENSDVELPITDGLTAGGTCVVTTDPARYLNRLNTTTHCPCGNQSKIVTRKGETFDYENDPPVNISLVFDDGNCPSEPRWIYVQWSDVPDKPVLELDKKQYRTDEGWVQVQPEYKIKDDDSSEKHTYSFCNNSNEDFRINAITGKIFTPEYLNLKCEPDKDKFEFCVQVTDKDGNMSNAVLVNITLNDINDIRPRHEPFSRTYLYYDCVRPLKLATLNSTDGDCRKDTNGRTEFIPSKTSSLTLNAQGDLHLVQAPVAGQTEVLTVQSTDRGEPPLVSEAETITLHGIPCPTTAPPIVVTQIISNPDPDPNPDPDTESDANARATATATSFSDNPWNIVGAILGGLLGLALLGLLGYLLYRFCGPCCSNLCYRYSNPPLKSNQIKPSKLSSDTRGTGTTKDGEGGVVEEEAGFVEGKKGKMIGGYRIKYGGYVEEHAAFSESGYGGGGYGYGAGGGGGGYGLAGGEDYGYGGGEGVIVGDGDAKADDYWKEHYMDKDLRTTPSRKSLPATVDKA